MLKIDVNILCNKNKNIYLNINIVKYLFNQVEIEFITR